MFDVKLCIFPFFFLLCLEAGKKNYINLSEFNERAELAFGVIYSGSSIITSVHFG